MTSLKGLIKHMIKATEDLLAEIDTLHSEADIEQEVTDKVTAAVKDSINAAVSAQLNSAIDGVTAPLQKQIDDNKALIQEIADKLTAGDVAGATQVAVTAAPAAPVIPPESNADAAPKDAAQ